MTTTDIEEAINGKISWCEFCLKHIDEFRVYKNRNDGVVTSHDLKLKFNSKYYVINHTEIQSLYKAILNGEIDKDQIGFIANSILLSSFDFESEALEDLIIILSNAESMGDIIKIVSQVIE